MPVIEWDESFSVNNAEIDGQHRKWLEIINQFTVELEGGSGAASVDPAKTLAAMMDYARTHFMFEEKYMREIGFPETIAHIKTHNECYGRIASYLITAESAGQVPVGDVLRFLRGWLVEHILKEDRQYSLHVAPGA